MQPCGKDETFSDVLVRYGTKYQLDRQESRFSLFGDLGEAIQIATPSIPDAPEWSVLDKLNKEKELIGIYLSAHPLDEYRVILENVCNVGMVGLEDKSALLNKELIFGGVVVGVRESRVRRNGMPCGFTVIEDFTGSSEIALFGEPWLKWSHMMKEDNYLFIKAQCVQNRYNPTRIDMVINSIELLQDIKDNVLQSLNISIPLSSVDKGFVGDLDSLTDVPGNTILKFEITRPDKAHLPDPGISASYIFCTEADYFVYQNNFNTYASFYKNTFQHGGISLEEMLIPFITMQPKRK
jgi:DNA polymerase-3 subunit alpha